MSFQTPSQTCVPFPVSCFLFPVSCAVNKLTSLLCFQEMNLREDILEATRDLGMSRPSQIQCQACCPISWGENVFAAARTGTGKISASIIGALQQLNFDPLAANQSPQVRTGTRVQHPKHSASSYLHEHFLFFLVCCWYSHCHTGMPYSRMNCGWPSCN